MASLLTDPNQRVRESMAELLVAVSGTRALHFYDIVPLDNLMQVCRGVSWLSIS